MRLSFGQVPFSPARSTGGDMNEHIAAAVIGFDEGP